MAETTAARTAQVAARVGVVDALHFRRLSPTNWAHLGGFGQGSGWAGVVDVSEQDDPLLAQVPEEPGAIHRFEHDEPSRVLGPYYALSGAVVRVSPDVVVVVANPTGRLAKDTSEDDLRTVAVQLDAEVGEVSPSKRLADELEVLHAVREVSTGNAADLSGTLQHIVDVAVDALSCDVGALRDGRGNIVVTGGTSGLLDSTDPRLADTLDDLERRADGGSWCLQETTGEDLPRPFRRADGVHALLTLPIPPPLGGVLVAAHTTDGPRGFTQLCQRLAIQLAEAASVTAHTVALRDDLRTAADEQARAARQDPLTGLGNRLAWDEALAATQEALEADGTRQFTVITLDVDGLKHLNDTGGHAAGDELLRRCAQVLTDHARPEDLVVRLGGDEFALLLPVAGDLADDRVASLVARLDGLVSDADTVAASVGYGTADSGGSIADAAREADAAMYAAKRTRRRRAGITSLRPAGPASVSLGRGVSDGRRPADGAPAEASLDTAVEA